MQSMTVIDALTMAHSTLQECAVLMRDAARAGSALNLLEESIAALKNPPADQKEVVK